MPIEFRCPSCDKLLRTPDDTAGKQAKCPQCAAIVGVPNPAAEATAPAAGETAPTDTSHDSTNNPYAAPSTVGAMPKESQSPPEAKHTTLTFDDVISQSWEITKQNLGELILCGVVFLAVAFVPVLLASSVRVVGVMREDPWLIIGGLALEQVVSLFVNTFFMIGMVRFGLRLARAREAKLNELFSGGRFLARGLLLMLVIYAIVIGAGLVCLAPALVALPTQNLAAIVPAFAIGVPLWIVASTYIYLRYYLALQFLVDREVGALQALRLSGQFMVGNKLTAFLVLLVINILAGVVMMCTLMIGMLVVVPYVMAVVPVVAYLQATGDRCVDPTARQQPKGI